jgi:hypothetical protein
MMSERPPSSTKINILDETVTTSPTNAMLRSKDREFCMSIIGHLRIHVQ